MQTQNRYFRGGIVVGIGLSMTVLLLLAGCGLTSATSSGGSGAPPAATGTQTGLQVTSVTMAVAPASIAGLACGMNVTVTYTATLHLTPNSSGGTVQFNYTVDNGRGQTPASITVGPGQTTKTYAFTWTGTLPADHTAPGLGGIQVTSPNQLTSPLIEPTGQCAQVAAPACGPNFHGSLASPSYQSILATDFGAVSLPPLSLTVPDDATGSRGYDICSAGTVASVTAYMQQNLPAYGWTLVGTSGGTQSWQNSIGTINWSVTDPLEWNINWHGPSVTAPACGSNFNGDQSYQNTLTTAYGTVPLPPLSRTVPNDASGGVRGFDICSAGTTATITAFLQQNLPAFGWSLVSTSGGTQTWKSSSGTINWSVADPLEWNINWRVPVS